MRILLVDDHAMVRDGLRALLEKHAITVVGECSNGRDAIACARQLRPDIVIMDVNVRPNSRRAPRMLAAGASGFLDKSAGETELLQAIAAIAHNQTYVLTFEQHDAAEAPISYAATPSPPHLTDREREVLQLIAEGHRSKEIAARLRIAVPTVETHRRQIMAKLGLHSVAELTKFAIREGLTPLD
jgi:DNA-binding NarL/FixJ family response regulator